MNRFGKALGVCALAAATSSCAATVLLAGDRRSDRAPTQARADRRSHRGSCRRSDAEEHAGARVETMRRFAVDELDLPSNDSYATYVALDRPYVVWNVVATEEFSVDPQRWCFPFAGCVAYRGYFDEAGADRFAAKLAEDGLDIYERRIDGVLHARLLRRPGAEHDGRRRRSVRRELAVSRARPPTSVRQERQRVQRGVRDGRRGARHRALAVRARNRQRTSSAIARGASVASSSASSLPRNKLGSGLSTRAALPRATA